jgi:hypothetical protein
MHGFENRRGIRYLALGAASGLLLTGSAAAVSGQSIPKDNLEVSLSRIARITPDASGSYGFFRAAAAPDDARHVMVCAQHLNLITNEFSGEVFNSADGGGTWNLRFVDASSQEISEDSCAFGESGKAYFIAQPWNVNDPYAPRSIKAATEMRLYRSSDYAESWPAVLVSPFVDYARIVVDSQPGSPFRYRAYIVGHCTPTEDFPLSAVLDGGKQLRAAQRSGSFPQKSYWGPFPRSLIVLKNGDVLASYLYEEEVSGGMSAVVAATRDGGRTLEAPVTIEKNVCVHGGPGMPSIAEAPQSGAVLAFYANLEGVSCVPTLAISEDKGRTWNRLPFFLPGIAKSLSDGTFQPGSMTVLSNGIALLTWSVNKVVYGGVFGPSWRVLWVGEISSDAGGSRGGINVAPYVRRDDRSDGGVDGDLDVSLQFDFHHHEEIESVPQSDNGFLVVWRQDDGQLYSRSIRLFTPPDPKFTSLDAKTDVTKLVRYEARNVTFDTNTNTFEYDLELLNASETPLTGPFLLKIKEMKTTVGAVNLKEAQSNEIAFVGKRSRLLLQGEHTSPVRIHIQASPEVMQRITSPANFARICIIGRVYAVSSLERQVSQ